MDECQSGFTLIENGIFLLCIILCVPCSEADDEIEALVKALVSSNPEPNIIERGRLRVPEGFDRSHQNESSQIGTCFYHKIRIVCQR